MLSENKFSKYLIYAIGEIVLVVIGILIAISINNWNSDKKDRQHEQKVLLNILKDINQDKQEVERDIKATEFYISLLDSLIVGLTSNLSNYNTEQFVRHTKRFPVHNMFHNYQGAYKQSISTGDLGLIISDTLRNRILEYYERDVNTISSDNDMGELSNLHFVPKWYSVVAKTDEFAKATKINVEFPKINIKKIANYPGFVETIIHKRTAHLLQINQYRNLLKYNQEVRVLIERELIFRWNDTAN